MSVVRVEKQNNNSKPCAIRPLTWQLTEYRTFDQSSQRRPALATNTITKAAARATQFIAGMENLYWIHLSKCKASKVVTFRIEDGRDTIGKLSMFCTSLRSLFQRDMVTLAGEVHYAVLVNHCLVADSFAILANCKLNALPLLAAPQIGAIGKLPWNTTNLRSTAFLRWVKR